MSDFNFNFYFLIGMETVNAASGGTEVGRFSVVMRVMDGWCIGLCDGIGEDGLVVG